MIPKQDRQGVRKAMDIEQKYDLNTDFSEIEKIATDAKVTASAANTRAKEALEELAELESSTDTRFAEANADIGEIGESVAIHSENITNLDERLDTLEKSDLGGEDGATFTPSVDSSGNLSWTNDKGLVNPATVNIKGDKGDKGDTGGTGANGVSATHSWNGTVLTVTSASGTSSADLKGEKGDKGDPGEGRGDMLASVYDPQGKAQDVFKYVEDSTVQNYTVKPSAAMASPGWYRLCVLTDQSGMSTGYTKIVVGGIYAQANMSPIVVEVFRRYGKAVLSQTPTGLEPACISKMRTVQISSTSYAIDVYYTLSAYNAINFSIQPVYVKYAAASFENVTDSTEKVMDSIDLTANGFLDGLGGGEAMTVAQVRAICT